MLTAPSSHARRTVVWPPPQQDPISGNYRANPANTADRTCVAGRSIDSSPVYTPDMTKRTMQEATFLILTALAAGSQHGYGIIADVAQISDGRVRLRAGTLYSALDRLRVDGLIGVDREEIV